VTPNLAQAINEFRNTPAGSSTADPDEAAGWCGPTSMWFIDFLADRMINSREVFMVGPVDDGGHEVVLAEGYYIDWTARQYDEAADHPALIEPWPHYRILEPGEDRNLAMILLLEEAAA
jgi:hypothetical protein